MVTSQPRAFRRVGFVLAALPLLAALAGCIGSLRSKDSASARWPEADDERTHEQPAQGAPEVAQQPPSGDGIGMRRLPAVDAERPAAVRAAVTDDATAARGTSSPDVQLSPQQMAMLASHLRQIPTATAAANPAKSGDVTLAQFINTQDPAAAPDSQNNKTDTYAAPSAATDNKTDTDASANAHNKTDIHSANNKTDTVASGGSPAPGGPAPADAAPADTATAAANAAATPAANGSSAATAPSTIPATPAPASSAPTSGEPSSAATGSDATSSSSQTTPGSNPTSSGSPAVASGQPEKPMPGQWRVELQRSADLLQREIAATTDAGERQRLEATLRLLQVAANQRDAAIAPMADVSPSMQEFWKLCMAGLLELLDPHASPVADRRAKLALRQLQPAMHHLGAASSLDVRNLAICRRVDSFGSFVEFDPYEFSAGQEVILYVEVSNFAVESKPGGFETEIQGSYQIIDGQGNRVADYDLILDKQISRNIRTDYFLPYRVFLPDNVSAGQYRIQVTLEDRKGQKFGQTPPVTFTIR